MKLLDTYIERPVSVITGNPLLEHLHTLKNVPVFMGCVETCEDEDILADMEWCIDKESGVIQLRRLIPPDVLYLHQHNDGTGKIWQNLYSSFAQFLFKHAQTERILEIGGAHDTIARNYMELAGSTEWTIVEPNPEEIKNERVIVIKDWFDEKFSYDRGVDVIVHSHVFEHVYDPKKFLEHIAGFLRTGQKHIFAFPNMLPMLEKKFTNCMNFEHTIFLTEYFTDYLLGQAGFKIIEKQYFGDPHSIFYATEKIEDIARIPLFENKYDEYKQVFANFVDHHLRMVADLNARMDESEGPLYLFGAHIFSQYLFAFGLRKDKIISVLDNSSLKQGKRLYGTSYMVESPRVLKDKINPMVILKAGLYDAEIKKDIVENINSNVIYW